MKPRTKWQSLSRPFKLIALSLGILLAWLTLFPRSASSPAHPLFGRLTKVRGFHFLTTAATGSTGLCRLLLSSAAAGYQDPVVLGWDGRGTYNSSESQLSKFSETLAYLRTLKKNQDGDLVLVVDAEGILVQLPPDVLIRRYERAIARSNALLKTQKILGRRGDDSVPVTSSVLMAAEKHCWPVDESKSLPKCRPNAPREAGPQFLNSGTLMGSVKDIRELFTAAMAKIEEEFNESFQHRHSDQHYMTMLWDEQQFARDTLMGGRSWTGQDDKKNGDVRREFGMALDQTGDVFLMSNWFAPSVTWSTSNPTQLSKDLRAMGDRPLLPINHTWADMRLGTNALSGDVFPIMNMNSDIKLGESWWSMLWFQIHPEATQQAARHRHLDLTTPPAPLLPVPEHVIAQVQNVRYLAMTPAQTTPLQSLRARDKANRKGGLWNDAGEYMTWDEVCRPFDDGVFVKSS